MNVAVLGKEIISRAFFARICSSLRPFLLWSGLRVCQRLRLPLVFFLNSGPNNEKLCREEKRRIHRSTATMEENHNDWKVDRCQDSQASVPPLSSLASQWLKGKLRSGPPRHGGKEKQRTGPSWNRNHHPRADKY
jgi:hypothetical protein